MSTTNCASGPTTAATRLTFESRDHVYRLGDRIIPSVTQILAGAGVVDSRWFNDGSRNLGDCVSQVTMLDDRGTLDESTVADVLRPYLDAWRKFKNDNAVEVLDVERRVHDAAHWYAGTLDRIAILNGSQVPVLVDIKTGCRYPWHPLQTSAYAAACGEHLDRGTVTLSVRGYSWSTHHDYNDRNVFYAACAVYHWKSNHGGNG